MRPIKSYPTGLTREEVYNSTYDMEKQGDVVTGDLQIQQEMAWYLEQDRNIRMCLILGILFGLGFLYSVFGAWRP
jgi:hypothetical protein